MIPAATGGRSGSRILVVEDDADTAESAAKVLTIFGHEVRIARNGPSAIASAVSWRPDFILLDIGLPGLDGYEMAERLRREALCRDTIIIAVTGHGQPEDRRRSRAAGIAHHLLKPAAWDRLLALLSRPLAASGGGGSGPGDSDPLAMDTVTGPSSGDGRGAGPAGNGPVALGLPAGRFGA